MYKTREEQTQLLHSVLAANDADAEEERGPGDPGISRAGVSFLNQYIMVYCFP